MVDTVEKIKLVTFMYVHNRAFLLWLSLIYLLTRSNNQVRIYEFGIFTNRGMLAKRNLYLFRIILNYMTLFPIRNQTKIYVNEKTSDFSTTILKTWQGPALMSSYLPAGLSCRALCCQTDMYWQKKNARAAQFFLCSYIQKVSGTSLRFGNTFGNSLT